MDDIQAVLHKNLWRVPMNKDEKGPTSNIDLMPKPEASQCKSVPQLEQAPD
jgi:hypothetical protein